MQFSSFLAGFFCAFLCMAFALITLPIFQDYNIIRPIQGFHL